MPHSFVEDQDGALGTAPAVPQPPAAGQRRTGTWWLAGIGPALRAAVPVCMTTTLAGLWRFRFVKRSRETVLSTETSILTWRSIWPIPAP